MNNDTRQSFGLGTVIPLAALALALIFGLWYFLTSPTELDRSIIGMQGFARVAKQNDKLDIRFFDGSSGDRLIPKEIGLRILPLYDPDIYSRDWKKADDLNKVKELRAMPSYVYRTKIFSIPTLVILPKWLDGARLLEKLHPDLLIDTASMRLPYDKSNSVGQPEIRHGASRFVELEVTKSSTETLAGLPKSAILSLYAPQLMSVSGFGVSKCQPLINGKNKEVLLSRCRNSSKNKKSEFWLLTDPDIMNNHGAGNGENYQFAVSLVKALAKGKPIIVDATLRIMTTNMKSKNKERGRSLADLGRFFVYPFSLFWIALGVLGFFTLWHAWRRNGPMIDRENERAIEASKATVIEANVAILRGSGKHGNKDIPLAWAYASQRMEALGAEIFGSNRKAGKGGEEQFFAALGRRNRLLAERLKQVRKNLAPHGATNTLFATLNEFENLIEEARYEFGRSSNLSR